MSRIRSIHPGTFTDDEFMGLPALAKVLLFGIWTEADDQGVFAWKPRTLKARLLPNDECDLDDLLTKLEAGRFVQRFEHSGSSWGAVRNFRKFQRPQKPTAINPLPEELRSYVCLDGKTTVALQEPSLTPTIKSPQMEDGGWREEKKEESKRVVADAPRPPKPDPKGTRLEPDWRPSAEDRSYAQQLGLDPERTADDFRDYWTAKPGKDGRKLNWPGTWRKWCRRAADDRSSGGGRRSGQRQPQSILAAGAAVAARYAANHGFRAGGVQTDGARGGTGFGPGEEFAGDPNGPLDRSLCGSGSQPVLDGHEVSGTGPDGPSGADRNPDRGSDGIPPGHRENSPQEMGSAGNVVALPGGNQGGMPMAHEEPASLGRIAALDIPVFLRRP